MTTDYEERLESQLDGWLSPIAGEPVPPGPPRYHATSSRRSTMNLLRSMLATTGVKVALGGAVAVSAAAGGGAALIHQHLAPLPAPATTAGSHTPGASDVIRPTPGVGAATDNDRGRGVGEAAVDTCRTSPPSGETFGQCVSAYVQAHRPTPEATAHGVPGNHRSERSSSPEPESIPTPATGDEGHSAVAPGGGAATSQPTAPPGGPPSWAPGSAHARSGR